MTRNVGGSILPSNDRQILQPIKTGFGPMQVRVLPEQDTHGIFMGEELLARHPNGYSCYELAKRCRAVTSLRRAIEQADYIRACGGWVSDVFYFFLKDSVWPGQPFTPYCRGCCRPSRFT